VVSHLNPIRGFLRLTGLKDWDIYYQKFHNTSVTRVWTDLDEAKLLMFNYSCFEDPYCETEEK